MTDREPRIQSREFSPHDNPEAFFAYLSPWEIADNTLKFARAGDFILPRKDEKGENAENESLEQSSSDLSLNGNASKEITRRTVDVSFDQEDEHVTMYLEVKGEDPRYISAHGVTLSTRHDGPQEFHYKVFRDRVVIKGKKEPAIEGTPDYVKIRSFIGRANLQLSLNLSYPSTPPSKVQ